MNRLLIVLSLTLVAFDGFASPNSAVPASKPSVTDGVKVANAADGKRYYQQYTEGQLKEKEFEERIQMTRRFESDVIIRTNGSLLQSHYFDFLEKAGITGKYLIQDRKSHIVHLGHYRNYDQAMKRIKEVEAVLGKGIVTLEDLRHSSP